MNTLPANIQTALIERNIDTAVWTTLQNSVFPGAKDESILLAVDYCKARKLDILKALSYRAYASHSIRTKR